MRTGEADSRLRHRACHARRVDPLRTCAAVALDVARFLTHPGSPHEERTRRRQVRVRARGTLALQPRGEVVSVKVSMRAALAYRSFRRTGRRPPPGHSKAEDRRAFASFGHHFVRREPAAPRELPCGHRVGEAAYTLHMLRLGQEHDVHLDLTRRPARLATQGSISECPDASTSTMSCSSWIRAVSVMRHSRGGIMSWRLDHIFRSATPALRPASFVRYAEPVRCHPSGTVG